MKNWIIALSILILPMVTYFVLEKANADTMLYQMPRLPTFGHSFYIYIFNWVPRIVMV